MDTAERDAALLMLQLSGRSIGCSRRITVGADKAYDSEDFVRTVRELNVTPHVDQERQRTQAAIWTAEPRAMLDMRSA